MFWPCAANCDLLNVPSGAIPERSLPKALK
jgi:hypothetical protein